jgi:amidophosphoribosyltransferase
VCGILGIVARSPVNQLLYDGLLLLQHRGQDAAGIVTAEGKTFHMHKGSGMVRDVFRTRYMRSLPDRRVRVQFGRGAAALRQLAVRHRPRP